MQCIARASTLHFDLRLEGQYWCCPPSLVWDWLGWSSWIDRDFWKDFGFMQLSEWIWNLDMDYLLLYAVLFFFSSYAFGSPCELCLPGLGFNGFDCRTEYVYLYL